MRPLTLLLLAANLLLLVLNVFHGSVHLPAEGIWQCVLEGPGSLQRIGGSTSGWGYIVWGMRIPAALTAALTGASLGVCGLLLQSYFRNPLAGPSILGITSGANLAVAFQMLLFGTLSGFSLTLSALLGALAVLLLLIGLGRFVHQPVTLLVIGVLLSYLTSAILTLLNYWASAEGVQALLLWGMGDFGAVGWDGLPLFASLIFVGLLLSALLVKPLNGWMLGELYAANLGISLRRTRLLLLGVTGLLCAVTTAYCGPIAFVGLSAPHMARLLQPTDDHRHLLPLSALLGALVCSTCLALSTCPDGGTLLPINALTPLFGVPVILYILLRG